VPEYRVGISFACDPEQVDTLVASAFAEIERMKTEMVDEEELNNIKEQQRREHETGVKSNRFWVGSLSFYDRNQLDFDGIFEFDQRVESLTREQIQAAAMKYLDLARHAKFVLKPEMVADEAVAE
jgi:zinc protease